MCPISGEIIQKLNGCGDTFDVFLHDVTNDFETAKAQKMFFPFLTVVDGKRYYAPISDDFLQKLRGGIMPEEKPYVINMAKTEKSAVITPITKDNYRLAARCTGRNNCVGCGKKAEMYDGVCEIIGFMHTDGGELLGGAEFFPSVYVPYDVPKGEDIAFITCVYMSDENFDYKSAPLRALEAYLRGKGYKQAVVISDEKGTFPNGDAEFFIKNGYRDEKVVFEDGYCRLHLFSKDLS